MTGFDHLLEQLRALAEPTRLRLLAICALGELTVGEIADVLGQSQPRVSRHLKLLCEAGLLARFREGHWVFYRLSAGAAAGDLARRLLARLDPADPLIGLDRRRAEALLGRRAERAAEIVDAREELRPDAWADDAIASAILQSVDTARIGALLDIGTGTGRMLRVLGPYAEEATGIDTSRDMRLLARARLHAAGLDNCSIRQADMYRLPFPSASFDTVTIDQLLGEASAPAEVIAEAARLLRPDGQMLLIELIAQTDGEAAAGQIGRRDLAAWLDAADLHCERERGLRSRDGELTLLVARRARIEQAA